MEAHRDRPRHALVALVERGRTAPPVQDVELVQPDPSLPPEERLRAALRRVGSPEFLTTDYLSLRLQLWSLAQAHEDFAEINTAAQARYRAGLADWRTTLRST